MRVSDFLGTPAGFAVSLFVLMVIVSGVRRAPVLTLAVLGPIAVVIVALLLWRRWRKED